VMKSYVYAAFETEIKKSEFHLYWYNPNRGVDEETYMYKNLSFKKMNKKEVRLFYDNLTLYICSVNGKDGNVWHHKDIGFNKESVRLRIQLKLF
jgi:hypothetical protein